MALGRKRQFRAGQVLEQPERSPADWNDTEGQQGLKPRSDCGSGSARCSENEGSGRWPSLGGVTQLDQTRRTWPYLLALLPDLRDILGHRIELGGDLHQPTTVPVAQHPAARIALVVTPGERAIDRREPQHEQRRRREQHPTLTVEPPATAG